MRSFLYGLTYKLPRLIVVCLATLAILVAVGTVKRPKPQKPPRPPLISTPVHIVEQSAASVSNCPDDPLMTVCSIVHVVLQNDSFVEQKKTLSCGEHNEEVSVTVSPRTRLSVDVEMSQYGAPSCSLK